MKIVLQRVKKASVTINEELYSSINKGLLIFFCVEKGDEKESMEWMTKKVLSLRIFEDENGKMNRSVADIGGEVLVVSQFTLAADCKKGTRPSFDNSAEPIFAKKVYEEFCQMLKNSGLFVRTGVFAAMMDVSLVNDGPVTILLNK